MFDIDSKPLIIIGGPTATGKSKLGVELAKNIDGEIISADSMQVYKYMDIGTAKPNKEELEMVRHHLIDIVEPDEEFSVARFKNMAKEIVEDIYSRGKTPIVVGGTGFYINSLLYDIEFVKMEEDIEYKEKLEDIANEKGNTYLHDMLKEIDPVSAENIHENNIKRVIRAMEFYHITGEKISTHNKEERKREKAYNSHMYVLNMDRPILYETIEKRVDIMIELGLVEEVSFLLKNYDENLVSMQGLGYKEIVGYLKGEYSLDKAVEILKRDTRRFAKRQLTWFRHQNKESIWLDVLNNSSKELIDFILEDIHI